jgi:hypothetical protein
MASLTVITGVLGKRATAIYLGTITISCVVFGLLVDQVYASLGIRSQAIVGQASEVIPIWAQWAAAFMVLLLSIKPLFRMITSFFSTVIRADQKSSASEPNAPDSLSTTPDCGPS